jgi:hypothetical protein
MKGYVTDYDSNTDTLLISVPNISNIGNIQDIESDEAEVTLIGIGKPLITPEQRRKVFALMRDITAFISGVTDRNEIRFTLSAMQVLYLMDTTDEESVRFALTDNYCRLQGVDLFSLSPKNENCASRDLASDFIDWLVNLCVENAIPCMDTLLNRCEDVERYVYACVANRRCAICGRKADIHEVDTVGMGRNRSKIGHVGQLVEPLCRGHHQEAGEIGQKSFDELYHLSPIRLDEHLCEVLGWRKKSKKQG